MLNAGRMMEEHVVNGLGALDDEGAFNVSSPLISEKLSNARALTPQGLKTIEPSAITDASGPTPLPRLGCAGPLLWPV